MFTKTAAKICFTALLTMSGALVSNEATAQPGTIGPIQLKSNQDEISIQDGGCQALELDAGPEFAGNHYLILGSVSGTQLGCQLGDFHIPLDWDFYTAYTLFYPNCGLIRNQWGRLNADGGASATLCLEDVVSPELVGMEISHCYVVFDSLGNVTGVSNKVSAVVVE